jgi:hypothetical protein
MAICDYCKREMQTAKGCTYTHAKKVKGKKLAKRIVHNMDEKCHDCNAIKGQPHHPGCDMERCPWCKDQAITCNCGGYMIVKKSK